MTDLLSCPFCGGAAEVYYGVAAHDGTHAYCTECEIRTEGYKTKAGSTWDVDAAITAWNRRALPAVQPCHVNETPKSEHDASNVLTPAKGDTHD